MKSFKDLFTIKSGVDKYNTFDLSCDSITTQNFFEPKVIYSKEIVPNESTSINIESFIRLSPLNYPSFIRCSSKSRAFFVPYRMVWRGWNYFITGAVSPVSSIINKVPTFTCHQVIEALISRGLVISCDKSASDFTLLNDNEESYYYYTLKGRRVYDILLGLGYQLCYNKNDDSYFDALSALPLLCYYKVIYDWYYTSQYVGINYADQVINRIGYNVSVDSSTLGTILFELGDFVANYDNDYFTSAFNNPSGPSNNLGNNFSINDQLSDGGDVDVTSQNIAEMSLGEDRKFSQFALDALKSLSDYVKRHQLAGSQVVDRFLARFGVKLNNDRINRSIYLGTDEVNIKIGDIQSTNANKEYALGTFAGCGVGYGNQGKFNINSDEFGFVIVVSDIVPHVGYSQGIKRQVMRISPLDFYTPEFDNLGTEAIAFKEIALSSDPLNSNTWCSDTRPGNDVFGWCPRYASYKTQLDFLSGNFVYPSSNLSEDAWIGTRLFNNSRNVDGQRMQGDITAGSGFLNARFDSSQYNRIFSNDVSGSVDKFHFRSIFHFNVTSKLPMSKLFDNYEFDSDGKELTMPVGGSVLKN